MSLPLQHICACGVIGSRARLRIWCLYGVGVRVPLSAQSNFQKDGFFEFILFYFYIRLTNKRIKRSPYSFPGSAISVFLLCKIPSERANLIFFQHKLTSETPSYLHYDKTIPTKTTLFFGNPYATNLF